MLRRAQYRSCHATAPSHRATERAGFSLIEVVVAIGIAGGALVVLLALLAGLLRSTEGSADLQTALRLAGAIEARLYTDMAGHFPGGVHTGRTYVADKDGAQLHAELEAPAAAAPPYFYIEARAFAQPPLAYEPGRAVLPLQVRVSWPYVAVLNSSASPGSHTRSIDYFLSLTPP